MTDRSVAFCERVAKVLVSKLGALGLRTIEQGALAEEWRVRALFGDGRSVTVEVPYASLLLADDGSNSDFAGGCAVIIHRRILEALEPPEPAPSFAQRVKQGRTPIGCGSYLEWHPETVHTLGDQAIEISADIAGEKL